MTKKVKYSGKERKYLRPDYLNVRDAVKDFQETASELKLEAILLKRWFSRTKDVEENGNHMR